MLRQGLHATPTQRRWQSAGLGALRNADQLAAVEYQAPPRPFYLRPFNAAANKLRAVSRIYPQGGAGGGANRLARAGCSFTSPKKQRDRVLPSSPDGAAGDGASPCFDGAEPMPPKNRDEQAAGAVGGGGGNAVASMVSRLASGCGADSPVSSPTDTPTGFGPDSPGVDSPDAARAATPHNRSRVAMDSRPTTAANPSAETDSQPLLDGVSKVELGADDAGFAPGDETTVEDINS